MVQSMALDPILHHHSTSPSQHRRQAHTGGRVPHTTQSFNPPLFAQAPNFDNGVGVCGHSMSPSPRTMLSESGYELRGERRETQLAAGVHYLLRHRQVHPECAPERLILARSWSATSVEANAWVPRATSQQGILPTQLSISPISAFPEGSPKIVLAGRFPGRP